MREGSSGIFLSGGNDHTFAPRVTSIVGREELGSLYEYSITFAAETPLTAADVNALLTSPCSFWVDGDAKETLNGVVREVQLVSSVEDREPEYLVVVVPSVWLLTLSRVSRVYQNVTVLEIATEVLLRFGLTHSEHFEIRAFSTYEKRELYVQYEESDWAFLERWFEREGLYYWFEHDENGDKLVITDDAKGASPIIGDPTLPFRDRGNLMLTEESIFFWSNVKRRTVAKVVLKDYNERNPSMPMMAQADADATTGFGMVFGYGEHFADAAAGKGLATKRAQRVLVEQGNVSGRADSPRLHVGMTFEMINHHIEDQNGKYLLTKVQHGATLLVVDADGEDASTENKLVFAGDFEAIPVATQYRSARKTAWPRIDGVMTAHIDSDATGDLSTLNEEGRYRVRLPFDSTGNQGEAASSWVRMATSYAGSGYGSHFPLHKGAEVLLSFLGGNPDRPVIIGAVPNAHTPGPSASRNSSQSVISSHSGIRFVMDDKTPDEPPAAS